MYKVDDRVKIVGMPVGEELSNATGTILGRSSGYPEMEEHSKGWVAYIILLDIPHSNGSKAISMIDSCIEPE